MPCLNIAKDKQTIYAVLFQLGKKSGQISLIFVLRVNFFTRESIKTAFVQRNICLIASAEEAFGTGEIRRGAVAGGQESNFPATGFNQVPACKIAALFIINDNAVSLIGRKRAGKKHKRNMGSLKHFDRFAAATGRKEKHTIGPSGDCLFNQLLFKALIVP